MKKNLVLALVVAVLMTSAGAIATVMIPTHKIVDSLPKLDLEASIPKQFGDWVFDESANGGVVNPQQTELLNKLYSQIVTRTYVNERGYRIMLSIAYGEDQRDNSQVHFPEICYPGQGFQLTSKVLGVLHTSLGDISVKRLETNLSQQRYEPVTYWTTLGNKAITDGNAKKIEQLRYGLRGQIPDGMLFRVSSIDRDSQTAFSIHEQFIEAMLTTLSPDVRSRVAGL